MDQQRRRIKLHGRLQGLGVRPLVWRIATSIGLTGLVRNQADGVCIEVQGAVPDIEQFISHLHEQLPASARIDSEQIDSIAADNDPVEPRARFQLVRCPARHGSMRRMLERTFRSSQSQIPLPDE
jgi:hydrogenase maturation factor HypF (carbamoyltransferase family)